MKIRKWLSLASFCFAAVWMLAVGLVGARVRAATVNTDPAYYKWPGGIVPYCIDSAYTADEVQTLGTAIQLIISDVPFIQFARYDCSNVKYKIRITPVVPGTLTPQPYSWSYPGVNASLFNQGAKEQVVSVVREPSGGVNLRMAMKMLVNVLGLRNEHQRGDRDAYLVMHPENISLASAYTTYAQGQALNATEFDYCSITLNMRTDYAQGGTNAFDVPGVSGYYDYMWRPALSRLDAETLSALYNAGFKSSRACCAALASCRQHAGGSSQ